MNALLIDHKDNVAVVITAIEQGEDVTFLSEGKQAHILARGDIPIYHKIAISDIAAGDMIVKYGYIIAETTRNIAAGEHVHCHNAKSSAERGIADENIRL